jgi:hypothetical protein
MTYCSKWAKEHPGHCADDAYYQHNREDQVIIFKLRTGHNRLKYHVYNKFKIGQHDTCTCGTSRMAGTHILQECPIYKEQRRQIWPVPVPEQSKLYGGVHEL